MRRSFPRAHDVCVHTIDRQTDRHKRNHKYSHSSHTTYFRYSYNSINSVKPFPPSTHLRFSVAALCDICMALCIQTRTNTMTPSPLLPVVRLRCGADDTYPPHTPVPHHTYQNLPLITFVQSPCVFSATTLRVQLVNLHHAEPPLFRSEIGRMTNIPRLHSWMCDMYMWGYPRWVLSTR